MKQLTLSQTIDGFMLEKAAQRLSQHTVNDYSTTFRKFQTWLGEDLAFVEITRDHIRRFMAWAADTPQSRNGAVNGPPCRLSKKTQLNYHTGLSALWTWAVAEGIAERHVVREVARPDPEDPAIVPFSEADVRALLECCDRTKVYERQGKRACDNGRRTALRDKTLLLVLLDTGVRAAEICGLTLRDLDIRNRRITVMGKGDKGRMLPLSPTTTKVVWRYVQTDRSEAGSGDPVFVTWDGQPYNRRALLDLLIRLGQRAGVADCHPHRFRHTFAINFLRNGANAYELQMALGHTTLEMVRRYLALAQTDVEAAHKRASPVEKWRLVVRG
jgi:integrase/recombinase XerD